jgi:SAM-dependent methyltransferase
VAVSSLFFHRLSRAGKASAFSQIKRVLSRAGELVVADWGRPKNPLMRAAFFPVRLLDGLDNTRDNVRGELPSLIRAAGFARVDTLGDMQRHWERFRPYERVYDVALYRSGNRRRVDFL